MRQYPDLGTNNGHKRLDLSKYMNLGATKRKKNQEFASYALLHMTCDLYYIVSPRAAPLNTSLAAE